MDADIHDPVAPVRRRGRLRLGEAIQVEPKAARSIAPAVQCLHQPFFLIFAGFFIVTSTIWSRSRTATSALYSSSRFFK